MTNIKNAKGGQKYYEGFGTYKTAAGWARALRLHRMTVWRYLQQGMTPEEIVELRELKTVNLEDVGRVGHRQRETRELMADLLDFSDYDPDGLQVNIVAGAYRHQIVWNDLIIGVYNPDNDVLHLNGGDSIKLKKPFVDEQQIQHTDGKWRPTSDTLKRMRTKAQKERLRNG